MSVKGELNKVVTGIKRLFYPEVQPPSYDYKRSEILKYAKQYNAKIFIETGTYKGDTPAMLMEHFQELHTIELSQELFQMAVDRFQGTIVKPHQGNSGELLPKIISEIDSSILFWLDGHYSNAPFCAKGDVDTPIMEELSCIFSHQQKHHVILVDDARLFGTEKDYPSLKRLKQFVEKHRPDSKFEVEEDIIRIII